MATFLSGARLRASQLEDLAVPPAATGARTSNQNVANATETDITLPTQIADTGTLFTPGDAHITIASGGDGRYDCKAWLVWAAGATGFRRIGISKNNGTTAGIDIWYMVQLNTGAGADVGQSVGIELDLVAGDTVRIKGLHNQGAGHDVNYARLSITRSSKVA